MRDATIGSRYALAIYEIANEKNKIEKIYDELKSVMEIYETDINFKNFVNHPLVSKEDKKDFLSKLFASEFELESIDFIHYLTDKTRLSQIKSIVTEYLKIYYSKNQIVEAMATFATEPSIEQVANLVEKLKVKVNKEVKLSTKIDESILGGVIIKIGDQIIDASIKKEIESFRNNY